MGQRRKKNVEQAVAIGQRLKALRGLSDMPVKMLAEKIGVSYGAWRNWEIGYVAPPWEKLILLADLLNTTVDHLLGRPPSKNEILDAARRRWMGYQCKVKDLQGGGVELTLNFPVKIKQVGSFPIVRDSLCGDVDEITVLGRKTLTFENTDAFVKFNEDVAEKVKSLCIAEALSYVKD